MPFFNIWQHKQTGNPQKLPGFLLVTGSHQEHCPAPFDPLHPCTRPDHWQPFTGSLIQAASLQDIRIIARLPSIHCTHAHARITGNPSPDHSFRPLLQDIRIIARLPSIHYTHAHARITGNPSQDHCRISGSLPGSLRSIAPMHTPGSLATLHRITHSGHYCRISGSFIQVASLQDIRIIARLPSIHCTHAHARITGNPSQDHSFRQDIRITHSGSIIAGSLIQAGSGYQDHSFRPLLQDIRITHSGSIIAGYPDHCPAPFDPLHPCTRPDHWQPFTGSLIQAGSGYQDHSFRQHHCRISGSLPGSLRSIAPMHTPGSLATLHRITHSGRIIAGYQDYSDRE